MMANSLELVLTERPGAGGEQLSIAQERVLSALARGPDQLERIVEKEAASRGWRLKEGAYRELTLLALRVVDEGVPGQPVEVPARPVTSERTSPAMAIAHVSATEPGDGLAEAIESHQFLWVTSNNPIEALDQIRRAASALSLGCYSWQEDCGFEPALPWCGNGSRTDLEAAFKAADPQQREDAGELFVFQHVEAFLYQQGAPGALLPALLTLMRSVQEAQSTMRVLILTASEHGSSVPQPLVAIFHPVALGYEGMDVVERLIDKDLTKMAREGEIEPLHDVENAISEMAETLLAGWNPLLVGPAGTGKTALVTELALRIEQGKLPLLNGRRVVEISVNSFIADTELRGSLERRVKNLLAQVRAHKSELIIFIDEAHRLVTEPTAHEATQGLKGALARGEFPLIAVTTDVEVLQLERDHALASRFQRIDVPPPNGARLLAILESVRSSLSKKHGIAVLKEAVNEAYELTAGATSGMEGQPRLAIQLLEKACARARMAGAREVNASRVKEAAGTEVGDWDKAGRLLDLPGSLKRCVRFQDGTVEAVAQAVTTWISAIVPRKRPYSMLFLGPSGVGKTTLAVEIAREFFGSTEALHLFPLEQYGDPHSGTNLLGSPRGYVGSDEPSALVLAAQRCPQAVFLFDELEKAHSEIASRLLNVMERGYFVDSTGARASFAKGIFIFTSNVLLEVPGIRTESDLRDRTKQAFRDHAFEQAALGSPKGEGISVPFLNRIDRPFLFRPLEGEEVTQIAVDRLQQELQPYEERGVTVDWSHPSLRAYFAGPYARDEGARPGVRKAEDFISDLQYWLAKERVRPPVRLGARYDPESRKVVFVKEG